MERASAITVGAFSLIPSHKGIYFPLSGQTEQMTLNSVVGSPRSVPQRMRPRTPTLPSVTCNAEVSSQSFRQRRCRQMKYDELQDGMRRTRLQNASEEYLSKREELRILEIESMKLRERVAELRRKLPQGPVVKDYVFTEGPSDLNVGDSPTRTIRLSELFTAPDRSLVIYQFMYGKRQKNPCPMCTLM